MNSDKKGSMDMPVLSGTIASENLVGSDGNSVRAIIFYGDDNDLNVASEARRGKLSFFCFKHKE